MPEEEKLPLVPAQLAALLKPQALRLDLMAREKEGALRELLGALRDHPALSKPEAFFHEVLARERSMNTGMGNGLAMPHARTELCTAIVLAIGRSKAGIDYGAADGQPVRLLFLLGTPPGQIAPYHRLVVGLSRVLGRAENRERLLAARDPADFIRTMASLRV